MSCIESEGRKVSIRSFVGHVQGTSKHVDGVTAGHITNTVIAHKVSVIEIANGESKVAGTIAAHAIVSLAAGSFISNSDRAPGWQGG